MITTDSYLLLISVDGAVLKKNTMTNSFQIQLNFQYRAERHQSREIAMTFSTFPKNLIELTKKKSPILVALFRKA